MKFKAVVFAFAAVAMTQSAPVHAKAAAPVVVPLAGTYTNAGGCQVFEYDLPDQPAVASPIFVKCPSNVTVRRIADVGSSFSTHNVPTVIPLVSNTTGVDGWSIYNGDSIIAPNTFTPTNMRYMKEVAGGLPNAFFKPILVNAVTGETIVSAAVYACKSTSPIEVSVGTTPFIVNSMTGMGNTSVTISGVNYNFPQALPMKAAACIPFTN